MTLHKWECEQHGTQDWPHDDCPGPGVLRYHCRHSELKGHAYPVGCETLTEWLAVDDHGTARYACSEHVDEILTFNGECNAVRAFRHPDYNSEDALSFKAWPNVGDSIRLESWDVSQSVTVTFRQGCLLVTIDGSTFSSNEAWLNFASRPPT
jgi:hypothetical protein